jgi:hypothetical protein
LVLAEVNVAETGGLMLLRAGVLTHEQLARANQSKREHGGTLGCHLVALGLVGEDQLADFYRHRLMVPRIGRDALTSITKKVIAIVPPDMAAEFRVVPVSVDREGNLTLAMADPSDTHAVDEVGFFTGHFVMRAVATESSIAWALDKYYSIATTSIPSQAPAVAAAAEPTPSEAGEGEVVLLTRPKAAAATTPPIQPPAAAPAEPAEPAPRAALPEEPAAAPPVGATAAAPVAPAAATTATMPVPEPAAPAARGPGEVVVEQLSAAEATETPVLLERPTGPPTEPAPITTAAAVPAGDEGVTLVQVELSLSGRVAAVTTPDAPAASPAGMALTEAIRSLREASDPEGVARALLEYFGSFCARAAFFTVRKGRLRCEHTLGPDISAAAPDFDASVDEPSVFREVMITRFPYRGALGESPAATALLQALPPPGGEDVVLVPVAVRHRVVSLAYGDRLTGEPSEAGMTRVALEAGIAYERLIASRKGSGGQGGA